MTATIRTLPRYYPAIFAQRVLLSAAILAILCVCAILLCKYKQINKLQRNAFIVLSVYTVVLLYFTFIGRYSHEEYGFRIYFFESYRKLFTHFNLHIVAQLLVNLGMLFPVGFLLPIVLVCRRKYLLTLLLSVFLTLFIETMQLVMKCGTFEIDDIINNIIGAALGAVAYAVIKRLISKDKKEKLHE